MTKIDDIAIQKRAKELCAQVGIAWDRFTADAPEARILNDRDRRECLMRARNELLREAVEGAPSAAALQAPAKQSVQSPDVPELSVAESNIFWPRRRAA